MSRSKQAFQNLLEEKRDLLLTQKTARERMQRLPHQAVDIQQLQLESDFIQTVKLRIQNLDLKIQRARKRFEKDLAVYFDRTQKRKVFDKVRERDYAAFKAKVKKRELKLLDDLYNSYATEKQE